MKKFSVLMVLFILILGLYGGEATPPLFDIDKELDSFKTSEVTEEEREKTPSVNTEALTALELFLTPYT